MVEAMKQILLLLYLLLDYLTTLFQLHALCIISKDYERSVGRFVEGGDDGLFQDTLTKCA
jgi:hypothetical protein